LEAATAQILAACPQVRDIQEQPLAIWYAWCQATNDITILDGPPTKAFRKTYRSSYIVPDFLVTMQCGTQRLIEVKPSSKLGRPLVQRKLSVARLFAERQDWTFHVITERQLTTGPLLANVRLLGRFRQLRPETHLVDQIEAEVARQAISVGDLLRRFATDDDLPDWRGTVWHLVTTGRVGLDPRFAPLSDDTILFSVGAFPWDPFDSVWGPSGCSTNGCSASSVSSALITSSPKI
jgi:hypothetical protein